MKTKEDIVSNWLPRYTGVPLNQFGEYVLLTNFDNYVSLFAAWHNVPVAGVDRAMRSATAEGITIINFGMGSPNAATIMDCLSAIKPKACLFLGKCGGLKKNEIGDLILPIAAIRGEGTSNDYFPPEVPALPSFALQKKYLLLTPEEWVRQHFVHHLINDRNYPKALIKIEGGLKFNSLSKRSDIVIFSRTGKPWMLVECKAPDYKLRQSTIEQASTYNHTLRASFITITNGMSHICCEVDWTNATSRQVTDLPVFDRHL